MLGVFNRSQTRVRDFPIISSEMLCRLTPTSVNLASGERWTQKSTTQLSSMEATEGREGAC